MRLRLWIVLAALLVVALGSHAQDTRFDLDRIQRATVFIIQTQTTGGRAITTCVGTGTIVDRSGLIASNAHNTVPNPDCPGDELIIALSIDPDDPPTPTYRAEVAQANIGLDLALLRITQELNGRFVEPGALALPFVELADSSLVALDDTITVLGYPGLGNEQVTNTRGTVTSFVAEPSGGDRAWIKTDATIPGTMTGGGVYNAAGQLIAVPTTVPIASLGTDTNCVALEDVNGDGLVNSNDSCVPIGGFINALRPSNFLRPLLRSASLGLSVEKLSAPSVLVTTSEAPAFSRLFISPSINQGMPTTVARNLPIGTNRLFLFFDYQNMQPDTIYELRVAVDGIPNATYSLAPVRWSGGTNGLWYIGIGSDSEVLPNGIYEFTLSINGLVSGSRSVIVGAAPESDPAFSNIFFCIEADGRCFGDVYLLPTGNIVSARFIHRNMVAGTPWTARWFFNDVELADARTTDTLWVDEPLDTKTIRLEAPGGLPPGRYRLELYIESRLAATSDFTVAGASDGARSRVFSNARFTNSLDNLMEVGSISSFPNTVREFFAVFDWEQIAAGTLWRMRWLVDGTPFYDETVPWQGAETGQGFITSLRAIETIPDGAYTFELYVNNVRIDAATIEAEVGIGQLPIDELAQTTGVQLNGQIIDSETRKGIPGVSFILISEDFSVADFEWDQEQVYAISTTDRNGEFQLDRLLQYEAPYSLVIYAEGYLPIEQDGIVVDADSDNPLEVRIPLTRE